GGTSMSDYPSVRDNVILKDDFRKNPYQRIFAVSAYSGVTNLLLEHKSSGKPGIFALFSSSMHSEDWSQACDELEKMLLDINAGLFTSELALKEANAFIGTRLGE